MAVTIDIPGIGNVEAKNAASESTLREILKAMQGIQTNTKKTAGGGGGSGEGGGSGSAASPSLFQKLGKSFGEVTKNVSLVSGGFQALNNAITGTISNFADVGDSVERAAKLIPVLGPLLGTVAGASVKLNDAFLEASKSGASFGGSVTEFARSASEAGMTLEKFGQFIAQNGQGILAFGGTTEEGAKRFTQVSKALRATSSDLYALGYSSEDINKGLANYGSLLRAQGLQGKQSNSELVAGAKKYMKELDALAKITGEERSVKEAEMKKLAQDAQFQAAMAGKSEEVRASFMKTVTGLPGPLQGFVKDFLATGTLTTEETQRIGAMMGGEVMNELQSMRNKMNAGQALTAAEQDRLAAIMKAAGDRQLKASGAALAASRENDAATLAMTAATTLQADANKKAAAEQDKAAAQGDGFNKRLQESQQMIAKFSNEFTVALANSGLLEFAMKAFGGLATLVQTIIVPVFNVMASIISTVGGFILDNFLPILVGLGAGLVTYGAIIAANAAAKAYNTVTTVSESAARTGLLAGLFAQIKATWAAAAAALGLSAPMLGVVVAVTAVVGLFYALYKNGWTFSTALEAVGDNLKRFGMSLMEFIDGIRAKLPPMLGGLSEEEVKQRQKVRDEARKELDEKEKARDKNRAQVRKERNISDEKEKNAKKSAETDAKIIADKKAAAEANRQIDANAGPEALAKQFAQAENSYLIPKDKKATAAKAEGSPSVPAKDAAAKADAAKKEVEAKGEEKAAAEKKAQEEAEAKKKAEEKAEDKGKGQAPTQESAESLLAQLNTQMAQLLKFTAQTTTNTYEQVVVTKGLSQDLYKAL